MPNVARYDDANTGGGIIKTIPQFFKKTLNLSIVNQIR